MICHDVEKTGCFTKFQNKHPECNGRGHRDDAISGRGPPPVLLKLTSLTAVIMATGGRSPEISNQPSNEEDELIKGE